MPWIGKVLHKPFVTFHKSQCGFAKLYTKFDGTILLKLLLVHFRNAPHKQNFTSDALNNRVATVASSNCHVKGEAAALSVHAQRCQSHYFSATPRIYQFHVCPPVMSM